MGKLLKDEINGVNSGLTEVNSNISTPLSSSDLVVLSPIVGAIFSDSGGCYCCKHNGVIGLNVAIQSLAPYTRYENVFTLPVGYRPKHLISFTLDNGSSTGGINVAIIIVANNGSVSIVTGSSPYAIGSRTFLDIQ